ncbi:hypothetical protein F4808DRAFT_445722 [Astrocystis sublimbata]|nr:hypothetical protein F4808DRAFT_445722 [Astrocystis sublimbata]
MLPSSSPFLNLVVGNSSSELDINTERIHALWLYYADLPNDDVEKLVIEYRHLIQLFQILLELPEIVPPNFELGQKVQQKAQQIQQQGLSPTDRSLIEEATGRNLGITVIEKGLVSAQGLGWKQKSHAEFVWLVSHITTAAHGILLVLAIDRPDLETINLRQKTMLAVFMKQRENILSCAALESTARSLYTTRDT